MAKSRRKKRGNKWFFLGMFLYALAFLGATAYVLNYLWGVLEEYEAKEVYKDEVTRNPMDAYMEVLTAEHVVELAMGVTDQVDTNLQSEEACREYLLANLTGEFSRKKYISTGNTSQNEYAIFCGDTAIGKVTTTSRTEEKYGYTVWEVTEESYDLSYLIGSTVTVTAPHDYTVSIGGVALDESYIIESGMQYDLLSDFYEDYDLPHIVTYQAGPFLGEMEAVITSPQGQVVTIDENTDWNTFLNNCSQEELTDISEFMEDFIASYVNFTSSKENRLSAYRDVITYMVSGGTLADRMYRALDGLQYNRIRGAYVLDMNFLNCVNIGDDRYMVDITYQVNVDKNEGYYVETNSMKIILVQTNSGLRAEAMTSY